MKHTSQSKIRAGFTLIELMVAMAITVVLLGILVYLTGVSMDTYRDSRNEVRASRQAKEALETISKDLESMISRRDGSANEWLYAGKETSTDMGPANKEITNTSHLIFFTGATDRYNGEAGNPDEDGGGDVSAVSYRLVFKDQISNNDDYAVFSLYRHLINPGKWAPAHTPASGEMPDTINTFDTLLAKPDLKVAYDPIKKYDLAAANFLVENIYEFTVTFLVEYTSGTPGVTKIERVTLRQNGSSNYTEFRVKGNKIEATGGAHAADIVNGRIVGAEVSITVLSDRGLTLAKKSGLPREELIKKHGYHYTKTITTPRP